MGNYNAGIIRFEKRPIKLKPQQGKHKSDRQTNGHMERRNEKKKTVAAPNQSGIIAHRQIVRAL